MLCTTYIPNFRAIFSEMKKLYIDVNLALWP